VDGKSFQSAAYHEDGNLKFSDRPETAPVLHFGGPLQLTLLMPEWNRSDPEQDVRAWIGTWGTGRGAFAAIEYTRVPEHAHPMAEVEFPNRRPGAPPVRVRYPMNKRC
jgi:hypothetical protein